MDDGEHSIRYPKLGYLSEKECPTEILGNLFHKAAEQGGDNVALAVEWPVPPRAGPKNAPSLPEEEWTKWSWKQYYHDSTRFAKALLSFDVPQHAGVNIFGFNHPAWFIGSMGTIMAGAKVAGIYPTDTADQVGYKCKHANAAVSLIEDMSKLEKVVSQLDTCPQVKAIVMYGLDPAELDEKLTTAYGASKSYTRSDGTTVPIYHFKDFLKLGEEESLQEKLDERTFKIKPSHCCVVIYTSGTTGAPKGVMLCHDNILAASNMIYGEQNHILNHSTPERLLCYLPLSHIAGFMIDIFQPMILTAKSPYHFEAFFARTYDLKEGTLRDRLSLVRPTIFFGVPRVWEKMAEAIRAIGETIKGPKKFVSTQLKKKMLY